MGSEMCIRDRSVSEDDRRWAADRLDSLIHGFEAEIDEARQAKEDDLLEV